MKVTLSWLNEFAAFGDDPHHIGAHLTQLGMAVEEIIAINRPVDGVVVAKVLARAKHPNADKIGIVHVDRGDGQSLQICCGAFNMQPGDLVALATIGTVMPDGRNIQQGTMRGELSNGMLCSQREIGVGHEDSGIWILPPNLELGSSPWVGAGLLPDYVFDLDLTRNRPETWGVVGIARDLAARLGLPFTVPGSGVAQSPTVISAAVHIAAPDRCGRFTSSVITGIEVGPSAPWMADRLVAVGMRSISNVVDVTNYVMLERNQPSHAYDLDTLGGASFVVRLARANERLVTLDGVDHELDPDDLLICDGADQAIGLAGVMGGLTTEITDATTTVALEVAWFQPAGIQRATVRHGLRSEASIRFERGVDPLGCDAVISRIVELLQETCPALQLVAGQVDSRGNMPDTTSVDVRIERVNAVLGTALAQAAIGPLLEPIGFTVDGARVAVPSWRPDCTTEIEVIEEIARQYGYDKIVPSVPTSPLHGRLSAHQKDRRAVRQVLLGLGCDEAMPNPWLGVDDHARAGLASLGEPVAITNPMTVDEAVLRGSLLPGLLKAVAYNEGHRALGVAFFEIGRVVRRGEIGAVLPAEHERLSVVLAGAQAPAAVEVWNELVVALGIKGARLQQAQHPGMHPGRSATIFAAGRPVGAVGEVHPDALDAFSVSERVAWLDLDLDALLASPHGAMAYKPVRRYPSSDLDLAFVTPDKVSAEQLAGALRKASGELLVDVSLFDVFRGPSMPSAHRSLAYRLRLQAADRTLSETELASLQLSCIAGAAKLGATLR